MTNDSEKLAAALRRMPVPEPRPGFVDAALARASAAAHRVPVPAQKEPARATALLRLFTRWETWAGAAFGACATAVIAVLLLPLEPAPQPVGIALALHESREIEVLIDSERDLDDATIRIVASGSVALDGFDGENQIGWQADLRRGGNLLSLPVVARSAGRGQLVATIEHRGRTRQVAFDLNVVDTKASQS